MSEDCFRSSQRFDASYFARPMNLPSRESKVCHLSGRNSNVQTVFRLSSRRANGSANSLAQQTPGFANDVRLWKQFSAIREPRPTKVAVADHFSPFTFYLSHQGYVCS
jgi:hypothetical protein